MTTPGSPSLDVPQHCGEPQRWVKDARYTAGGFWRCPVESRDRHREQYAALNGHAYNRLLLVHRRAKALARRRARQEVRVGQVQE